MAGKRNLFDVVKASGRTEAYQRDKIIASLRRAGADASTARKVAAEAEETFYPGITTRKIFQTVMDLLEKRHLRTASLYDLKGSVRRLGPAGYAFETYIGELYREQGHRVRVRQILQGRCAAHEIDIVIASGDGDYAAARLAECKFHQSAGTVVNLKEVMYSWARLIDINERPGLEKSYEGMTVVTNARASQEAMKYAACRGVDVLAWDYPPGRGLEKIIKAGNLYPVTVLRATAAYGPDFFSRSGLMLARDFVGRDAAALARTANLPLPRAESMIREAEVLLGRRAGGAA